MRRNAFPNQIVTCTFVHVFISATLCIRPCIWPLSQTRGSRLEGWQSKNCTCSYQLLIVSVGVALPSPPVYFCISSSARISFHSYLFCLPFLFVSFLFVCVLRLSLLCRFSRHLVYVHIHVVFALFCTFFSFSLSFATMFFFPSRL